jgi:hypothetical protein
MKAAPVVLGMVVLVAGVAWWTLRDRNAVPVPGVQGTAACSLPPRVRAGEAPLQTDIGGSPKAFQLNGYTLTPLAGFSVEARVLSRETYRLGREAELSPLDLALGWQRMREDAVLSQLRISQSSRWYQYSWSDQPPLPPGEIISSSANMHMIPANAAIAAQLAKVERDDNVRLDGWLVEASASDGWHWRSSTSRQDSGGGACEVVYVCAVSRTAAR